ncbi:MAG TPA: ABC transporter substrate-binding protein [Polyangiaceae bacterium]|nr:ABC transporter substrate-binding protein [Polyangiaceae bacterium]
MIDARRARHSRAICSTSSARLAVLGKRAAGALGLGLLLLGLADCRPNRAQEDDKGSVFPRTETFYLGGRQWGEPSTFNPIGTPGWPISTMNLLYETLLMYNSLDGRMQPLLAESYAVHDDSVEVTLNAAARWNDGQPVSAWDVTFTFGLGQRFKSLNIAPIWQYLASVRAYDKDGREAPEANAGQDYPRRVVFALNPEKKNPLVVLDALQAQIIVPRHVIEPLLAERHNDLDEFKKLKFEHGAVSSGPYRLFSSSSEKIAVVRDDDYWGNVALHGGKKPAPKYIVHPLYKSNDAFSVALRQGRLDLSTTFVPRIWLKAEKGVRSWLDREPYFLSSSIPMLLVNHKRAPLMDVHLRRAMAFAINYDDIRELSVSGYSEPLRPGIILPFGLERRFFSEEDAQKYGTWFDPARAKAELAAGGYTSVFGPRGELVETRDRDGKRVPTLYVKSPTGWTDWESIVRVAVKSMRAAGIDVRERFVETSLFWNALYEGDFDLIMHTPSTQPSPSKPWSRFEALLTSRDFVPLGQRMYKNIGRFNDPHAPGYDPRIDELLALIPTLTDDTVRLPAYRELNALFMREQPYLPLVYRPDTFYEFSIKHWANLPSAANPYLPPLIPGDRLGTNMLWSITPVSN